MTKKKLKQFSRTWDSIADYLDVNQAQPPPIKHRLRRWPNNKTRLAQCSPDRICDLLILCWQLYFLYLHEQIHHIAYFDQMTTCHIFIKWPHGIFWLNDHISYFENMITWHILTKWPHGIFCTSGIFWIQFIHEKLVLSKKEGRTEFHLKKYTWKFF